MTHLDEKIIFLKHLKQLEDSNETVTYTLCIKRKTGEIYTKNVSRDFFINNCNNTKTNNNETMWFMYGGRSKTIE